MSDENKILLNLAMKALDEEEFKDFSMSIDNDDGNHMGIVMHNHIVAQKSALKSVYKGDCDLIIFDHYRKAVNLLDAIGEIL